MQHFEILKSEKFSIFEKVISDFLPKRFFKMKFLTEISNFLKDLECEPKFAQPGTVRADNRDVWV